MVLEVNGKQIKVRVKDEPYILSWDRAKAIIQANGWRLPTIEELNEMYKHKDEIGGFTPSSYWSSSEYSSSKAWEQYFASGHQGGSTKGSYRYVRLVRDVNIVPKKTKESETVYWSSDLRIVRNGDTIEFSTDYYPESRRITVDISVHQVSGVIDALSKIRDNYY